MRLAEELEWPAWRIHRARGEAQAQAIREYEAFREALKSGAGTR